MCFLMIEELLELPELVKLSHKIHRKENHQRNQRNNQRDEWFFPALHNESIFRHFKRQALNISLLSAFIRGLLRG